MPITNFILNIWIWMQCHFVKNLSDERYHIYNPPPLSPILSPEKAKIKTKQNTHVSKKHLITCNKLQELPVKNF